MPANPWGLHEVHGNVWEWVEDFWHDDYHGAPRDVGAWVTGGIYGRHVLRAGSCNIDPGWVRSANRDRTLPDAGGFRLARVIRE